jgi:hypothetical protein
LLIISVVIIGFKLYNKPHVDVVKARPDIVINSQKIIQEFQINESLANKKYLDKIVQVSGSISKIEASENNDIILTLLNDESAFGAVICHLSSEENKKLSNLKEGQNVTIKGICTGYLMDVIIVRCSLIKI